MKKSFKKIATAGALIGVLTVSGVSTVAFAAGNAYQNYKSAVLQTVEAQNMTVAADITIKQDSEVIMSGNTNSQIDGRSQYSNSQIQADGKTTEVESSTADGTSITRIGDQYTSTSRADKDDDWNDSEQFGTSSSTTKLMEMVTDLLVGDVKAHFTGSGDTISVNLEGAQIPELLNVAASAMVEQSANQSGKMSGEDDFSNNAFENLSITQNVQVKRISLEAELKDGYTTNNVITIVLTGTDSSGTGHEIELFCTADISDIGSTTPATIDTTGKTVTEATSDYDR